MKRVLMAGSIVVSLLVMPTISFARVASAAPAGRSTFGSTSTSSLGVVPLNSGQVCNYSSDLNDETCFQIDGPDGSTYVNDFYATSEVIDFSIVGHLEIYGPNGFYDNTPDVNITPSAGIYLYIPEDQNMPAGTYCAATWEKVGANSWSLYASACASVHS